MEHEEFKSGMDVTYGSSKLVWQIDEVRPFVIYLNRQHMKPNSRHHLSFKTVREEDFSKLHIIHYPEV